jgi:hypothetical protein
MSTLTFCAYPTDWIEEQSLQQILSALKARGVDVHVDRSRSVRSKVGLFLGHHVKNRPHLAECPVVMLHDLGQAHNVWPGFWDKEPWGDYHYGILPYRAWEEMYENYPTEKNKPKYGVATLGWPKSDNLFNSFSKSTSTNAIFKGERLRVLYAPSWEFDNQQDKFLRALVDLPIDIFIKQQHWDGMGHLERVQAMADMHRGKWPNVTILDPKTKIFDALALVDCIVSDESSTMVEGFMVGCVPISVMDWKVPDTNPPRPPSVPFPFINKVLMKDLPVLINNMTDPDVLKTYKKALDSFSDYLPPNRGTAASVFADFLLARLAETSNAEKISTRLEILSA